jgi:hypothetical protein
VALAQLKNPFNVDDVMWKPTDVKQNKCTALAYADLRTYQERLDLVFGPQNWSAEISRVITVPYKVIKKAKRKDWKDPNSEIVEPEQMIEGHRVMVAVRISVNGMLPKESTGVSESEDENSITTAEAQAFKRAASMLYIGKYFYYLPRYRDCDYAYKKITNPPTLPDWAIPATICEDCAQRVLTTEFKTKDNTVQSWNPTEIARRSQQHFGKTLCMECMRKRRELTTVAEANTRVKKAEAGSTDTNPEASAA